MTQEIDKEVRALDDRLACGATVRDGFVDFIHQRNVADNREMCFEQRGLGGSHLAREHLFDAQPDRSNRLHHSLLFGASTLLLLMVKLLRQGNATDEHYFAVSDPADHTNTEMSVQCRLLQGARQRSARAIRLNCCYGLIT